MEEAARQASQLTTEMQRRIDLGQSAKESEMRILQQAYDRLQLDHERCQEELIQS